MAAIRYTFRLLCTLLRIPHHTWSYKYAHKNDEEALQFVKRLEHLNDTPLQSENDAIFSMTQDFSVCSHFSSSSSTLTKARLGMAVNGLKVYLEILEDIFDGDESKEALETTNTPLRNKIVTWTPRRRT